MSYKSFKQIMVERISNEEILVNPSMNELKSLCKVAGYNSIRFTINSDDDLKAGDVEKYTHQQIEPAYRTVQIRGIIRYKEGKYFVKAYGAYDMKEKHHPKIDQMFSKGMINQYE